MKKRTIFTTESGTNMTICDDFEDVLDAFKNDKNVKQGDMYMTIDIVNFTTIYTFNGDKSERPFNLMIIPGESIDKTKLLEYLEEKKKEFGGGLVQRKLPGYKKWNPKVKWEEF